MAKLDVSEWIQASAESKEEMIQKADGQTIVALVIRAPLVLLSGKRAREGDRELGDAAIAELGRRLDLAAPPKP